LRFFDRVKLAFNNQYLFSVLQKYAEDFLAGNDVPTQGNIAKVDAGTAMRLSAVFACNRVLAETLATCPIHEYEKDDKGNRRSVTDTPEFELLHYAPNPDMTPGQFKESGVSNINLGGNFFAQKVKNAYGKVIQLRPITWDRIKIDIDKSTGTLKYFLDGSTEAMTRDDILHIPGITLDGYIGITPIEFAQNALTVGSYQDRFTRNFYENGVQSSGVFEHPNALNDDAYQRLKKDIKKNWTGLKNAGVPMILEDGMKYREVTMKLTDAQFIESKRFTKEEIASLYRVPLHLIQDLSRSTNNNIEHQSLEFVMYTMLPWIKRWEENLNLQMLSKEDRKKNRYFEFKLDSLLRGDAKTRAEAYAVGRQWGWLSVNDIRRLENMNGIGPAGDIYLTPANMYEAGKEPTAQQKKAHYEALAEEIYNMITRGEKHES
jgi:HK97 family phage portal protein